ncbi:monofunctional biosynthetic peptidoglycan transglycosylase [Sedimentitalea sp. CY04]|uniref:Biosynthetic peptidoglycan transglycosylase n=1 Tax=Parasedimentitalea denitrificans TaxID=2211118 RepID=A0ABX0W4S5_9RHOB|nr:monofunctional biosynthetic peptidoglycan transglycosylase [Sedimentitalea sp. CY04]NIZ60547.1 monofunctional biosynthetic peptidoglycan transglycosylase [Sedimentitalea sp. CY04]
MAKKKKSKSKAKGGFKRWIRRWLLRLTLGFAALIGFFILLFSIVNPPTTHTMWTEGSRLGRVEQEWVAFEDIAPVMARTAVAAEDARFCQHWGIDVRAVRAVLDEGAKRGGSTISQQVVKNVFLWQDRSWLRKALETLITPAVEAVWSKQRILEVYLNVAEMGEGVFGVKAAARKYFDVPPDQLNAEQASLLAAVLPAPKTRSAKDPSPKLTERALLIADGAATIRADGRAGCFED